MKKKQEDSEWTKFPGIKIVDGEIYFRGFSVRKISRIGDSKHAMREIDQNMKKKIMNNMMAMIPEKVMTKLNSKYNGAVKENLSSKIFGTSFEPRNIKIGKQVKFLNITHKIFSNFYVFRRDLKIIGHCCLEQR